MEILSQIFELCIIPLLGILVKYLVEYLTDKKEQLQVTTDNALKSKYTSMLIDTVKDCVIATNQTYVESLKKEGKFDEQAQSIAFQKTFNSVTVLLTEEAKNYLSELYGDLDKLITQKIEATVNENK